MSEWIRVEDELPAVGQTVVVLICEEYPALVELKYPVGLPWPVEPIENGHKITHWMLLPKLPKTNKIN